MDRLELNYKIDRFLKAFSVNGNRMRDRLGTALLPILYFGSVIMYAIPFYPTKYLMFRLVSPLGWV